ncbi:hypothetical protein JZ751_013949 [Albula glossodonta]|uniref:CID domain-containing protein n=1 Tax=Albula glossodonta TaxID=121402 RepID=A0A8T2MYJ1_9TELE|nr:hypothetical protein JZ751_013949 [Albula glossodonta]
MSDDAAREDACREYLSSLEDLTFNSKPHINMLTILAEENLHFAKDIVAIIEAQIAKVDENTRKSLFKLRSTWDDIFPLKKLYALDVRVNSLDPAWPIKPLPPNVNASIHVNPKFLKQNEEVTPRPSAPQPIVQPVVSEKNLTHEQAIRQQLLAKQKQLLELQQKKIELELEQTKAQLPDSKVSTRDPRLNRAAQAPAYAKEQVPNRKDAPSEKKANTAPDKQSRLEKTRIPKKDFLTEEKPKSKSPSPLNKGVQGKSKNPELENVKAAEVNKRDPRLRKHLHDKSDSKEEEVKEKKRGADKKEREDSAKATEHRPVGTRSRLANGSVNKHEPAEKPDSKTTKGNARKRSRSRSRSPALHSPKRKDRRSPKRRTRSISSSPPKSGKGRQAGGKHQHTEDFAQHAGMREERGTPKKSASEPRRPKRSLEERPAEARETHSPRLPSETKENANKRWKSGWEENKHLKQPEEVLKLGGPPRHKAPWSGSPRVATPRTPKQHRLSVDANLQIPEVLNSANKRDLLKKIKQLFQYQEEKQRSDSWEDPGEEGQQVCKKKPLLATPPLPQQSNLSDAEISYYEHKAKLRRTQVQRQGNDVWEADDSFSNEETGVAEIEFPKERHPGTRTGDSHYRKPAEGGRDRHSPYSDRLQHQRQPYEETDQAQSSSEMQKRYGAASEATRLEDQPSSRHDELRKNDRPSNSGLSFKNSPSPVNFEGKSPVRGFDGSSGLDVDNHQMAVAREPSPSQRFDCELPIAGSDSDAPMSVDVPLRHDVTPGPGRSGQLGQLLCEASGQTPPHASEGSHSQAGLPRFDGPKHSQRFDGPQGPQQPMIFDAPGHMGQPRLEGPSRSHISGRFDVNQGPGRFDGPSGPHGPSRFDGQHPQGPARFDGPQGPGRFDGQPVHKGPERFEGPNRYDSPSMQPGPARFSEPQGLGRFDGPHVQQGTGRFDGPIGQQPPGRFDGQGPIRFDGSQMQHNRFDGPMRFDNPHMQQQGLGRFESPVRFGGPQVQGQGPRYDGPQPGPVRYDGPVNQPGAMRFENPQAQLGPMRYDGQSQGMARFDGPSGQQPPPRYCGPPGLQNQMRPQGPPMYDTPQGQGPLANPGSQQLSNFNMAGHRFTDPVYSGGPQPFQGQSLTQGGSFSVPAVPATSNFPNSYVRPVASFYNPGAPGVAVGNVNTSVNVPQPMNMLSGLGKTQLPAPYSQGQPFMQPQNAVPFGQTGPQFASESHFGQVDVNDLLTKLIENGIIKSTPTDAAANESAAPTQTALAAEEEEEEEQEDDHDVPDLTGFVIEDMKQRYESVITKLYTGIQCYSCGMRFTASQTDVYADHLDWHYRQNRSEKDISKKDWIEFEEIADLEERAKSQFFEKVHEEVVQKTQEAAKEKEFQSVKAAPDVVDESCEICQEAFEMYWEEEEEEWHLKNAIRVDEKTYHPSCYEDYKNTSSFVECTPSPSKAPLENPLQAFIKQEEDALPQSSSVTQEAEAFRNSAEESAEDAVKVELEA